MRFGFRLPVMLREPRGPTWSILGALNKKTPGEVGEQSFIVTVRQVVEVLNYKDLIDFFQSFARPARETSSESSEE